MAYFINLLTWTRVGEMSTIPFYQELDGKTQNNLTFPFYLPPLTFATLIVRASIFAFFKRARDADTSKRLHRWKATLITKQEQPRRSLRLSSFCHHDSSAKGHSADTTLMLHSRGTTLHHYNTCVGWVRVVRCKYVCFRYTRVSHASAIVCRGYNVTVRHKHRQAE